jgi:hypothetical protein
MEINKSEDKMEITACPNCGSKKIGVGNLSDGIVYGLTSWKEVCKDCGYQGAPVIFKNEEIYNKYLTALKDYAEQNKKPQQKVEPSHQKKAQGFFARWRNKK